ncbi:hypothetical protein HOLleu_08736 [Holothuria leucospilota]|uniref:Zinc finger PHD-type domain-containing protein n=1 Tax=Holothuria leucospilota TaxID=206669 RepID=A0A9Q1CI11_HOLLE|nr:hypothetical protein HOLleu_08736 [Holothuria leucospilota]
MKGLGAALMQTDTNGESRVIAFGSRSLKGAEKNYSATELECLAVLWAFEKWRPFIEGSQITVFTDHKALVWMLRNKALKGKLVRWALRLQEFDYTVHYRPGIQNMIPDALSRAPQICSIDYDSNVCFHKDCKGDPSNVVNWVQCDSCDKWYHCRCLKITKEEADDLDPYVCVKCELEVEKPESAQALKENCKVQSVLPDRNQFILHQQKDPALLRISSKLESNSANDDGIHKQYVLEEGVLKYVDLTTGVKKVVVPTKLVQDVIIHFHCTPTCPHLGVKKTVERVKDSNWVERVNRNLVSMLCCFVGDDHTSWDTYVMEFMFALNSFRHETTGFTPSELFLQRKIQGPGEWVEKVIPVGDREEMLAKANENMRRQNIKNKLAYDEGRSQPCIKVGDKVLLKSHPLSNLKRKFSAKLAPSWRGPYKVIEQLSPTNFCIQSEDDKRIAHVEQLKNVV